jgi:hypothetical protein
LLAVRDALVANVGGELHQSAAVFLRERDGAVHQRSAVTLAAQVSANAHRLDRRAPRTCESEPGCSGELQHADDLVLELRDQEVLVWISAMASKAVR